MEMYTHLCGFSITLQYEEINLFQVGVYQQRVQSIPSLREGIPIGILFLFTSSPQPDTHVLQKASDRLDTRGSSVLPICKSY